MRKSWLLCVLLGTLSWGQAAPGTAPPAQPAQAPAAAPAQPAQAPTPFARPPAPVTQADTAAAVPDTAAVITVNGVCPPQPKPAAAKGTAAKPATVAKTAAADCKTVVTKHEVELLLNGLNPPPPQIPQVKKNIEAALPKIIAMSTEAEKRGLDKTAEFKEQMKIQRMQLLASKLQQKIKDDADKVSDAQIEKYYKANPEAYQQFTLDRLIVPRTKQVEPEAKLEDQKSEKPTDEQKKAKEAEEKAKREEAEQAMSTLAESLRTRAAAGEDFAKLQKEAYDAAGFKIESPNVSMPPVRRTGLSPSQASVFDLKAGDVSQVINDTGGHYIYKVKSIDVLSLDQVKEEIRRTLQTQNQRDMMDKVTGSLKVDTNAAYFGPGGPGPGMPPRPVPRMAPPAQAPQQQTPPPAQAPTPKPN